MKPTASHKPKKVTDILDSLPRSGTAARQISSSKEFLYRKPSGAGVKGRSKLTATKSAEATANAKADVTSTEDIVRELLAEGVPIEKIRIPGHGLSALVRISDDFDAPLEDFIGYI